jgi:hypothetical protein
VTATGQTQLLFSALGAKIIASTALTSKLGTEVAANHVIYRRFRRGSEDPDHAQRILLAPMVYIWPGYSIWKPMTPDNCRVESTVNVTIVQRSTDTGSNLSSVLEFADALVEEIIKGSDSMGAGTQTGVKGTNLRARIDTPSEEGNASVSEVKLNILFTGTLFPVV